MINKQISTYVTSAISFFLVGMEYGIIIPSLNPFLVSINAEAYYVGLSLSAMNITALLASPIFGKITDFTRTTKVAVMASNLFEIAGNAMYFSATNPIVIVGSRLIVGVGSGSTSSILSMISRSSSSSQRTSLISLLYTGRQVGLLIGPACNFFLQKLDFYIFSVHINQYTAPGFFMAVLWTVQTLAMSVFYHDLDYVQEDIDETATELDETIDDVDSFEDVTDKGDASQSSSALPSFWRRIYNELVREEIVTILALTFSIMFVQVGVEALITPLSHRWFGWGEIENSAYYSGCGALYVVSLVSLSQMSKSFQDRKLILFGIVCLSLNNLMLLFLCVFAEREPTGKPWILAVFILYGVILCLTMPYGWVPLLSMFSKFTSQENQGFNIGVRIVCMKCGEILGPLWASSLLNHLTLLTSVNFAVLAFPMVLFFASYDYITKREKKLISENNKSEIAEQETPLLSDELKKN